MNDQQMLDSLHDLERHLAAIIRLQENRVKEYETESTTALIRRKAKDWYWWLTH